MVVKLLGIQAGRGARQPGAEDGPYELRRMGLCQELAQLGHQVEDLGDIPGVHETRFAGPARGAVNHLPNVLQVNRHTHACVLGTRRADPSAFLLVIGGDHSLAIGTLAGLSDSCRQLGLLWIDAHGDFNTPASSPSGNIHGMSLAVACGHGHRELRLIADRDPMIQERHVHLMGCRDLDRGEQKLLAESDVNLVQMDAFRAGGATRCVLDAIQRLADECDHVHLSFDLDVIDPTEFPATGTRVPGGLAVQEALELMAVIRQSGAVHSAEIVEYHPKLDPDGACGRVVIGLAVELLGDHVTR